MKRNRLCWSKLLDRLIESPTTRRAGGLDFSAIGGKKQRHGSALIGAGVTACASMAIPLYERDGLDFRP